MANLFTHRPERELITGSGGSGKSTLFRKRIRESKANWKFVYDFEAELARWLNCPPATTKQEIDRQTASGVCLYYPGDNENLVNRFDFFCDYVFEVSKVLKGTKCLFCDEVQDVSDIHSGPPNFQRLMERGRHWGIDAVCVAQGSNELHNSCRNQFYRITAFMQVDENATKFLKRCGMKEPEILALKPGQYISRNRKTGQEVRGEVFKAR